MARRSSSPSLPASRPSPRLYLPRPALGIEHQLVVPGGDGQVTLELDAFVNRVEVLDLGERSRQEAEDIRGRVPEVLGVYAGEGNV